MVTVSTIYEGAGPEEIEQLISKELEDEISTVEGIKHLQSISQQGLSLVMAEFYLEIDVDAAAAVPLLPDGRVVLVEQWRHAVGQALLEIPAGLVEAGEQPAAAMQRELSEEIKYTAGRLELLFSIYLAPGYSQELIHIFLAEDLQPAEARSDDDEILRIRAVPLAEAVAACLRGEIADAKTITGLLAVAALRKLD